VSTRQLLRQLEYIAKSLAWSSGDPVFFDVVISSLGWEFLVDSDLRHPYLIITHSSSSSSPENPQIKTVSVSLTIVVIHEGDPFGRLASIGGHGSHDDTDSAQKGVLELQEKLWASIHLKSRGDGIIYQLGGKSDRLLSGVGTRSQEVIAVLEMGADILIFEESVYPSPSKMTAVQSGSDVVLTWVDHAERYDRISTGGIIVARKSGSNPTSADQIATVAAGVETYTDVAPGSGTWYYGLFAKYDETNDPPSASTNVSEGIFRSLTI